jgi:nicotinamidase-related amidase
MRAALLLVDLQNDYLDAFGLEPRELLVERASVLLAGFRSARLPVLHAWTTLRKERDERMPHWRRAGYWACVEGTPGHATPLPLQPRDSEPVVHKTFYSAFEGGVLERTLRSLGVDTLCLAGIHLHACIRTTAIDAYQHGFGVCIAEDAVASYDELHAQLTRSYLADRIAEFHPVEALLTRVAPEVS